MSRAMMKMRQRYVLRYGERFGRIMFVDDCQRRGIDPLTGRKLSVGAGL